MSKRKVVKISQRELNELGDMYDDTMRAEHEKAMGDSERRIRLSEDVEERRAKDEGMIRFTVSVDWALYNDIDRLVNKYEVSQSAVVRILLASSLGLDNIKALTIAEQLIVKDMGLLRQYFREKGE